MKKSILILATFLFGIQAKALMHIIGDDNRVEVSGGSVWYSKYPIVYLNAGDSGCTGTLVSPTLVLTNLHCVLHVAPPTVYTKYNEGIFESKLEGQRVFISSDVKIFENREISYTQLEDWALVELSENIGNVLGYCPIATTAARSGDIISLSGYHADLNGKMGTQRNCEVQGVHTVQSKVKSGVIITTDCDSVQGSSGASLLQFTSSYSCKVAGLHFGHYSPANLQLQKGQYATVSRYDASFASAALQIDFLPAIITAIVSGARSGNGFQLLHPETQEN